VNRLQEVSSETHETSKACTGDSEELVATGSSDGGWGWGGGGLDRGGSNGGLDGSGGVGIHWGSGWDRGGHWLDDGARAVGDGQGGAGSDGVGNAVEGQAGGTWADGGVCSVHLSGVHDSLVRPRRGSGCKSSEGDDGGCELHLDGCMILFTLKVRWESWSWS